MTLTTSFDPERDLLLQRTVDVSPELVWLAWTTPKHLMKWFTPAPWKTIECDIDLRPGGVFRTKMQGPDGQVMDLPAGCYLDVVPNRRLIWTDALGPGYRPNANAFFTAALTFEPKGSGTVYTAHAMHRDPAGKKQHEDMGFLNGWGTALDQLVAYAKTL